MNTKEHDSDVATCRACLLADAMKPCKNGCHCRFNVGLVADTTPQRSWITEAAALMADALDWDMQIAELRAG